MDKSLKVGEDEWREREEWNFEREKRKNEEEGGFGLWISEVEEGGE